MGFGGNWDNNPVTQDDIRQANEAVDTALESDIRVFDLADIYTFGKAETVFGKILKQRPALRNEIVLQSKCGIRFADTQSTPRTVKHYDLSRP